MHYDPAFAYEIGHIVKDGLRRMYGHEDPDHPDGEDLIYYLTVYNEPVGQPGAPEHLDVEALLKGMYRYAYSPLDEDTTAGAGAGLRRGDDRRPSRPSGSWPTSGAWPPTSGR